MAKFKVTYRNFYGKKQTAKVFANNYSEAKQNAKSFLGNKSFTVSNPFKKRFKKYL